jgi:hypothetical protein
MNQTQSQISTSDRIGPLQIAIVVLAAATGLMHIWLAIPENLTMFYLNGIGYLVLAGALYLPALRPYRKWIRFALMAYTLVTILGWVFIGMREPVGYINKAIEVTLLILLIVDWQRSKN